MMNRTKETYFSWEVIELMIIRNKKYIIVTKTYPLLFLSQDGYLSGDFEDVHLFATSKECEAELSNLDEDEEYQMLVVDVQYEF